MNQLKEADIEKWLQKYKEAWESRNPDQAVNLFADNAQYFLSPFESPFTGKSEIRDYWEDVPIFQTNNKFQFEVLFVKENKGFAHCHGTFELVVSGDINEMDGIFEVEMDENGKCKRLRQWWHQKGVNVLDDKPHA